MQKALAIGTHDSLLFFHAASIERQLGNPDAAEYARKAIALNPQFHVLYAEEARRWAMPVQRGASRGYQSKRKALYIRITVQ